MAPPKKQSKTSTGTSKARKGAKDVDPAPEVLQVDEQPENGGTPQKLIHDDQMVTQLDSAYLGSAVVDIRALSNNERNRAIDERFIAKLSEAFKCGVRRFAQEDRLKVTTTSKMLETVLTDQITEMTTLMDLHKSLTKKTSDPVS